MKRFIGWVFVIICLVSALLAIVFSFTEADARIPGSIRMGAIHFLIPIAIGWLAMFPRSLKELRDLATGHPIAQRFFGGKPSGFFGDYRRKLTRFGTFLIFGLLGLFILVIWLGAVQADLFIISFLYIAALSLWIIRLELGGDRIARLIRDIASALVYQEPPHHGA